MMLFILYTVVFVLFLITNRKNAIPKALFYVASIPLFFSQDLIISYLSFELCFFLSALVAWDADKRALYQYLFLNVFSGALILSAILLADTPSPITYLLLSGAIVATMLKIGIVPFHVWVPDLYETSPNDATAFLASFSSAISLLFAYKLFLFHPIHSFSILLALFSIYAAFIAFGRRSIKKAYAYLSIMESGLLYAAFPFITPEILHFLLFMKITRYLGIYLSLESSTFSTIVFSYFSLSLLGFPPTGILEKIFTLPLLPLPLAFLYLINLFISLFTVVKWMSKKLVPSKMGGLSLIWIPILNIIGALPWIL